MVPFSCGGASDAPQLAARGCAAAVSLHRSWNLDRKTGSIYNILGPNHIYHHICLIGRKTRLLSLFLPDCGDNDHRKEDPKFYPLAGASLVS